MEKPEGTLTPHDGSWAQQEEERRLLSLLAWTQPIKVMDSVDCPPGFLFSQKYRPTVGQGTCSRSLQLYILNCSSLLILNKPIFAGGTCSALFISDPHFGGSARNRYGTHNSAHCHSLLFSPDLESEDPSPGSELTFSLHLKLSRFYSESIFKASSFWSVCFTLYASTHLALLSDLRSDCFCWNRLAFGSTGARDISLNCACFCPAFSLFPLQRASLWKCLKSLWPSSSRNKIFPLNWLVF